MLLRLRQQRPLQSVLDLMRHATLAPLLLLRLLQQLLFGLFAQLQCYPTALPLLLLVWASRATPAAALLLLIVPL
jgi:hypothetical protein